MKLKNASMAVFTVVLAAGACAMLWYPLAVKADSAPSGSGPSVSLSLNQAIGIALSDNISYRQAIADERAAEARVVQATAGRTPRPGTSCRSRACSARAWASTYPRNDADDSWSTAANTTEANPANISAGTPSCSAVSDTCRQATVAPVR